jgi:hypothetical protein
MTLAYQSSNILDNFYTDGTFTYIYTTTLTNMINNFQSIITYCNTYIPSWKPSYNNPGNRIAYNSDAMFELIFYKNLILIIPLYLSCNSIPIMIEKNIVHLRNYITRLCLEEDLLDNTLITTINYKLIFYSPIAMLSSNYPINLFKTKKTIIHTDLYTDLFQSYPILLSTTSLQTPVKIPPSNNSHIYMNTLPDSMNTISYNNASNASNTSNSTTMDVINPIYVTYTK